jgi:hypothetical protein
MGGCRRRGGSGGGESRDEEEKILNDRWDLLDGGHQVPT